MAKLSVILCFIAKCKYRPILNWTKLQDWFRGIEIPTYRPPLRMCISTIKESISFPIFCTPVQRKLVIVFPTIGCFPKTAHYYRNICPHVAALELPSLFYRFPSKSEWWTFATFRAILILTFVHINVILFNSLNEFLREFFVLYKF
jgi:hypothetical protein